jgi:hypothetical protein
VEEMVDYIHQILEELLGLLIQVAAVAVHLLLPLVLQEQGAQA